MNDVKIAHAVSDEFGKAGSSKTQAGDQTGREIRIDDWYDGKFTSVFRAKDAEVAEKIAQAAEAIAKNNNVGYNQLDRTSLAKLLKGAKDAIKKIKNLKKKCNTDCSAMVAQEIKAAGINISDDMYTGNERALILATKQFNEYVGDKYTRRTMYLKRGDILHKKGHTATVLNDGCVITRLLYKRKNGEPLMWGDDVTYVQYALNDRGYNAGMIDGEFGTHTESAVKLFQSALGLEVDGIVGKETAKALGFTYK